MRGFYNSGITTGYACAQVAYKCLTSPTDYPINDGSFRSLNVDRAAGPRDQRDAAGADALWMTFPMTIVDTIFKALGAGDPGSRHRRPSRRSPGRASSTASIPRTSEFFIGNFGPLGGGWGAKRTEDGVSGTVCINDGDTHNSPNEQVEAKFPLVVERYALIPDSGGAGRHRGGLGVERVVRARSHVTVNTQIERAHCQPWGLAGGGDGTGNDGRAAHRRRVEDRLSQRQGAGRPAQGRRCLPPALGRRRRLRRAAVERPVEDVRNDVRQGYVSVEAAATLYGVIVDPVTFAVDEEATARRRAALASPPDSVAAIA